MRFMLYIYFPVDKLLILILIWDHCNFVLIINNWKGASYMLFLFFFSFFFSILYIVPGFFVCFFFFFCLFFVFCFVLFFLL